jgi:hypothetical protein
VDNNATEGNGGNVYVSQSMELHVLNSTVDCQPVVSSVHGGLDPVAINGGGMYFGPGARASLKSLRVESCLASTGGGMFVAESDLVNVTDGTQFVGNQAEFGGGIAVTLKAKIRLADIIVENNRADYDGAGMHIEDTEAEVQDVLFVDNVADSRGGAMYLDKQANMALSRVTFVNNTARGEGGAMYLGWGARSDAEDCRFGHNIARSSGGAVFVTSTAEGIVLRGSPQALAVQPSPPTLAHGNLGGGGGRRLVGMPDNYDHQRALDLVHTYSGTGNETFDAPAEIGKFFRFDPSPVSKAFTKSSIADWRRKGRIFVKIEAGFCEDVSDRTRILDPIS